jgi:hypothetical protein
LKYGAAARTPVSGTPDGSTRGTLRAMAAGPAADGGTGGEAYAQVVDDATEALADVETAARFLSAGGTGRLARTIVEAVRAGDGSTVRRGREALSALRAFQVALDGHPHGGDHRRGRPSTANGDHFHSAHGTVLGGDGERDGR